MDVYGCLFGWWFGTCFIFHFIYGIILPIDELHHFSRWLKPPTRIGGINHAKKWVVYDFVLLSGMPFPLQNAMAAMATIEAFPVMGGKNYIVLPTLMVI